MGTLGGDDEGHDHGRRGEKEKRRLLHYRESHEACAPASMARADSTKRIDIERHEHDGQPDHHDLGEKRGGEAYHRRPVPAASRASVGAGSARPEPYEQRAEGEHPHEDVSALRDPGHGFDPQRVEGEEERGNDRGPSKIARASARSETELEKTVGKDIAEKSIEGVDEQRRQVIARGVHSPDDVVEGQGQPRQGSPVGILHAAREDPAEIGPAEPAEVWIAQEVVDVVPVDPAVPDRGEEDGEGHPGHDRAQGPEGAPRRDYGRLLPRHGAPVERRIQRR